MGLAPGSPEDSRVQIGASGREVFDGFVQPGGLHDIDGHPGPFRPEPPEVGEKAHRVPRFVLELQRRDARVVDDAEPLFSGRRARTGRQRRRRDKKEKDEKRRIPAGTGTVDRSHHVLSPRV